MPSDLELVRQLGGLEADARRLTSRLDLMLRQAEAAPTEAMIAAHRYYFRYTPREELESSIARMKATLADLFCLINDLKRRYFPERTVWDGPLSYAWMDAIRDAELDKLVEEDRQQELKRRQLAMVRMSNTAAARQRRKPGHPRKDGMDRLLAALAS